jgi:fluoride ion exporter CrcB/FEX
MDGSLAPQSYENLDEVAVSAPIRDRRPQRNISEDERRASRGTPGAEVDITALPEVPDAAEQRIQELLPVEEYLASKTPNRRQRARTATGLYTVSYLVLFSILGALARVGLRWLTLYPGAPVVLGDLWANFAGTLLMGFFSEDRQLFRQEWGRSVSNTFDRGKREGNAKHPSLARARHATVKKTIPLYIGLTVGFCGTLTTFSGFMRDCFLALSNDLQTTTEGPGTTIPRNGGYSFMAVCAILIITICVCYSALRVGAHVAIYTERILPSIPFGVSRRIVDPVMVLVAWGAWLGAVFMAIWPPDRPGGPEDSGSWARETWRGDALFACVFAPLGCLARFVVSLRLNAVTPSFPLGTFAVNIFGTAVIGMAYNLQHVPINGSGVGGGRVACQVLQGIMDGFCGALTTVSTWILELDALRRGHSYVYGGLSVASGLALLVVVMGSVRWSVGWSDAVC